MIYGDKDFQIYSTININFNNKKNDKENDSINETRKTVKYPDIQSILQQGNLYGYCINNPIKFKDHNGECIPVLVVVGVAIYATDLAVIGAGVIIISLLGNKSFRDSFATGINSLEMNVKDALVYAKGKAKSPNPPSKLVDSKTGKVKTPDTNADEFSKNKDGSYKHKKSGWTFKRDKSNHRGPHWDASPDGKTGNYINVSNDGKIL